MSTKNITKAVIIAVAIPANIEPAMLSPKRADHKEKNEDIRDGMEVAAPTSKRTVPAYLQILPTCAACSAGVDGTVKYCEKNDAILDLAMIVKILAF